MVRIPRRKKASNQSSPPLTVTEDTERREKKDQPQNLFPQRREVKRSAKRPYLQTRASAAAPPFQAWRKAGCGPASPSSCWRYYRRRSCRRSRSCATKVSHRKSATTANRPCLPSTCRRHGGGTESPAYCSAQCLELLFVLSPPSLRSYPSVSGPSRA